MVALAFNPSTQETEASGSLWVQGQPGLQKLVPGKAPKLQRNPVSKYEKKKKIICSLSLFPERQPIEYLCCSCGLPRATKFVLTGYSGWRQERATTLVRRLGLGTMGRKSDLWGGKGLALNLAIHTVIVISQYLEVIWSLQNKRVGYMHTEY